MAALCLGMVTTANAQAGPEKNNVDVEIGFTPFKSSGESFKLNEGMFKVRWHITDKDALRFKLGVGAGSETVTSEEQTPRADDAPTIGAVAKSETTQKNTSIGLSVGYERTLLSKNNFDFYVGAELGVQFGCAKTTITEETKADILDQDKKYLGYETQSRLTETFRDGGNQGQSVFGFKGNIFAGVDWFVYKNLYVGAELGISFGTQSKSNAYTHMSGEVHAYNASGVETANAFMTYNSEDGTTWSKAWDGTKVEEKTTYGKIATEDKSNFDLKFYVEPAVRLGWRF